LPSSKQASDSPCPKITIFSLKAPKTEQKNLPNAKIPSIFAKTNTMTTNETIFSPFAPCSPQSQSEGRLKPIGFKNQFPFNNHRVTCLLLWIAAAPLSQADDTGKVPGLTITEYPRHAEQVDEASFYLDPGKMGEAVGTKRITKSIDPWTWTETRNATARGELVIPEDGDYGFLTKGFYDRSLLMINGKVICAFQDGEETVTTIPLKKGKAEIRVVGYLGSRGSASVLWRPPGQKELGPIPSRLLMTDRLPDDPPEKGVRFVVKNIEVEVYQDGVLLPDATVEFELRETGPDAQAERLRKGKEKTKEEEMGEGERPKKKKKEIEPVAPAVGHIKPGASSLQVESPRRWTVQVLVATYGTGGKNADVTEKVARFVEDKKRFSANPVDLGTDPNPGWNKSLHLVYIKDGVRREQRWNENGTVLPETLYGPQDAGELTRWLEGTRWTGSNGEIQFHPSGLLAGPKLSGDAQWKAVDSRKIRLTWANEESKDYDFDYVWSNFKRPDDGKDGYRLLRGDAVDGVKLEVAF